MHMVEHRRNQRFHLQLPLAIMRTGMGRVNHAGTTRNISSSGVLFSSDAAFPVGGAIEYMVTLHDVHGMRVNLRCIGKVLRTENPSAQDQTPAYLVAATLDRYEFQRHDN